MAKDRDLEKSIEAAQRPVRVGNHLTPNRKGVGNVARAVGWAGTQGAARTADAVADEHVTALKLAFVGAGQGGSRIANAFYELGYRRVALFNTTDSDFEGLNHAIPKLSLDIGGAAKDMEFARRALDGRGEDVWDLYTRAWGPALDYALVCVGLGGGSGSGAALPLVKLARQYMDSKKTRARVGAVVSLPGVDEGQQVARNAVQAFRELLAAKVSPLLVIDNERVHSLFEPPMSKLLPRSNELVSQLLHLFNSLAAVHSEFITFDQSELAQLLDGGLCVLGSADLSVDEITSPADVSTKIRDELANSVLAEVDLRTGKKAACLFVGSQAVLDSYSKDFFSAGFTQLNRIVGSAHPEGTQVVIHRGLYRGETDGLQVYTLISELDPPLAKLQVLAKEAGLGITASGGMARYLKVD